MPHFAKEVSGVPLKWALLKYESKKGMLVYYFF